MSFYKSNLLNHFKDIQPALAKFDAQASIDARTFRLEIRANGNHFSLHPQFVNGARGVYTPYFQSSVNRFIGWCPYFNKRWAQSDEKLKFKEYVRANGLRTPDHSLDPQAELQNVIVKRSVSSFGKEIRGPFRSSSERRLQPGHGEFYESLIQGRILKVWFWNYRAVCAELENQPSIEGDGRQSIGQLIIARSARRGITIDLDPIAAYLAFVGLSLDHVLQPGESQAVDFKYGSQLNFPPDTADVNLLEKPIAELTGQLAEIGSCLWHGIPEQIRQGVVYSVDAVCDAENRLWLLEMNSNPFIHPFVYAPMLSDLIEGKVPAFTPTPEPVAPQIQRAPVGAHPFHVPSLN